MAKATLIEAPPAPEPPPVGVTLELSFEEAKRLRALLGVISGINKTRRHCDEILQALNATHPEIDGVRFVDYFDFSEYAIRSKS